MKTDYKNFTVSASFTGSKKAPWAGGPENWNHHTVTVKNNLTREKTSFDFWASIASPRIKTEYDLLNALYCFVSAALDGEECFSDFCAEYGYNEDSRTAEKVWRACRRAAEKWKRVSDLYDDEMYDFINELPPAASAAWAAEQERCRSAAQL